MDRIEFGDGMVLEGNVIKDKYGDVVEFDKKKCKKCKQIDCKCKKEEEEETNG